MREIFWVGAGGAVESIARYAVVRWLGAASYPGATLSVNLVGSLVLGLIVGLLGARVDPVVRAGVFIGILGALTKFSMLSVESIRLLRPRM